MQPDKKIERRKSTKKAIKNIVIERKQLLSLLFQASNINVEDKDFLDEFCQILVDYIAAGHFVLYERILEKRERRKAIIKLAEKIYPEIEKLTQIALDFNEKYIVDQVNPDINKLKNDFSVLGEALTARIELEDQLISKLTNDQNQKNK